MTVWSTEIDRVSETTKFNETYLLKGNTDGATSKVKLNAHDAGLAGKLTLGISSGHYSNLENGHKTCTLYILIRLCQILDTTPNELLEGCLYH